MKEGPQEYECKGLPDGAMPQTCPKTIIATTTVMVFMFWSPIDFLVIIGLLPRVKFNACYFCRDIIPEIVERMSFDLALSPRKLILHMDNASPTKLGNRLIPETASESIQAITRRSHRIWIHLTFIHSRSERTCGRA
jgi:hypothetical protein